MDWWLDFRRDLWTSQQPENRSPILWGVGMLFVILRRLSLLEYPNHFFFAPGRIPAWFVDGYILVWLAGLGAVSFALDTEAYRAADFSLGWTLLAWFCALQVVQVNVHRNMWRRITHRDGGLPRIYGRNLVNALIGFATMNWLFGLVYWLERSRLDPEPTSVLHAICSAFISGTTLGYSDIHPAAGDPLTGGPAPLMLGIAISHTLLSLVMIAVAIGATVTTIEPKGQLAD
ncbi:hypothetical protein Pla123a_47960 [Posidoniimonas polymericola]|uniref:Ion channel n=1 Tax=Posidoniimonas polymericola TaxID=2528002 RepID=A0A5C5XV11_9BACT|nr:hypothetical protein [Posidoniimonas polymericola]TWT65885.1 hypothetical protein Pla123a_47960 [Posidoniimonas polymericola]